MLLRRAFPFVSWVAVSLLAVSAVLAAASLAELQDRFDKATDSVKKAKILPKLGDAEFKEARAQTDAGNYEMVDRLFEKYRDNVRVALDGLEKDHPDAERHPSGYQQIQIHVRDSLLIVRDTNAQIPEEYRARLEKVREDLTRMNDEMIARLFPRRPTEKTLPPAEPQLPGSTSTK